MDCLYNVRLLVTSIFIILNIWFILNLLLLSLDLMICYVVLLYKFMGICYVAIRANLTILAI